MSLKHKEPPLRGKLLWMFDRLLMKPIKVEFLEAIDFDGASDNKWWRIRFLSHHTTHGDFTAEPPNLDIFFFSKEECLGWWISKLAEQLK